MGWKTVGPGKNFVSKKFWIQKSFGSKQIFGPKRFRSKRTLGLKKIGSEENFGFEKPLDPKRIFLSEKFLCPKKCSGQRILDSKLFEGKGVGDHQGG